VNVTPDGPYYCDPNISVTLSIPATAGTRKPVDVMVVFDKSGSMSWGGQLSTSDALGIALSTSTALIADSSGGLRDINVANPGLPMFFDTYNSPGIGRDVDAFGNYAYLADGTQGLRVVGISNPINIFPVAQVDVGGGAYGVAAEGDKTYVVTFSSSNVDESMTAGTNQVLVIGRNASNLFAAQSFIPSVDFVSGAMAYVRRVGNPIGNLEVNIRATLNGPNLGTATLSPGSLSASYQSAIVSFPSIIPLTSGSTYYLVLTTPSTNNSNYYQWGARNGNAYSRGNAYQNTSSQNWDARFQTHFIDGLIVLDTSTPTSPTIIGAASLDDGWRVWVDGGYAYVADGISGMRIFDVTQNTPQEVGFYNTSGYAYEVSVDYPYAFVSDGLAGVRFFDISNPSSPNLLSTYNTPGTAYAARADGTILYVADGSSLQVLDFSTINTPAFIDAYTTPYRYRDLEINNGWAYLAVDNAIPGLITIDLSQGPKVDQAIVAAQTFIDFNGWSVLQDQMGLVTYNTLSYLDEVLTSNFAAVRNTIGNIVAFGGTATGSAIDRATNELQSVRANPLALKFQVLMSDGQTNYGTDPDTAAIAAANANIIIYTIGFGADADEDELKSIASITGGQYYFASDANALVDIYALIAQNIQNLATDANISTFFDPGTILVDDGNGSFSNGTLVFDINTQLPPPWMASYIFNIPCDSQLACETQVISIPSPGTFFEYIDTNGESVRVDWNVFVTDIFNQRDLNIQIHSGDILSPGNVDLGVEVISAGTLDAPSSEVRFYRGPPTQNDVLASHTVPPLCGQADPVCAAYAYTFTQNLGAEGELYAVVNPDGIIPECSYNNEDVIFCYALPNTQFFTLDYWAWLHE
ncbi:MAG: VWA domain-containing protein, partial [archaeon]|nr:VWA domain-containing protein [archaeon]